MNSFPFRLPPDYASDGKIALVKLLIVLVVLVALVIAAGFAGPAVFRRFVPKEAAETVVRVERVAEGDLTEIVSAPGQVQPRTKVQISARVAARIERIPVKEGDPCLKHDPKSDPPGLGTLLIKLDSTDLEAGLRSVRARRSAEEAQKLVAGARVAAQEAQIAAARANLAEAERNLKRQDELLASKDVSQAIVDEARSKVDSLAAQLDAAIKSLEAEKAGLVVMQHNLEAAEAEIARATDALSYTTIRSPIDGTVTKINAKEGELVVTGTMNNAGTVIMEVADLSAMLVNARIDESSIARLEAGQPAKARMTTYQNEVFDGVVETVALTQTEEKDGTKYYKAEVLLKTNGRRIFAGLTADVDIETKRHVGAVKVPSQCVLGRRTDDLPADLRNGPLVDPAKTMSTVVYRYVNGKAVVTPVKIGPSDDTHTVVLAGLTTADQVITGPYKVLEPLAHDQVVKDEKAGAATQPTTKPE